MLPPPVVYSDMRAVIPSLYSPPEYVCGTLPVTYPKPIDPFQKNYQVPLALDGTTQNVLSVHFDKFCVSFLICYISSPPLSSYPIFCSCINCLNSILFRNQTQKSLISIRLFSVCRATRRSFGCEDDQLLVYLHTLLFFRRLADSFKQRIRSPIFRAMQSISLSV